MSRGVIFESIGGSLLLRRDAPVRDCHTDRTPEPARRISTNRALEFGWVARVLTRPERWLALQRGSYFFIHDV